MTHQERFDDLLDSSYESVTVAGIEFPASKILKECDPIAYRCAYNDWCDDEGLDEEDEAC